MSTPLLRVWSVALALALALLAAPLLLPEASRLFGREPPDAPVLVVGTSLTGYGVPPRSGEGPTLLGDGRAHVRLYEPRMTEARILRVAGVALGEGGIETLILEIYPFVRDFADEAADREAAARAGPALRAAGAALATGAALSADLQTLVGLAAGGREGANRLLREPRIHRRTGVSPETLDRLYPVVLRAPRREAELGALLAAARAAGAEVYFFAPPVSEAAAARQGAGAIAALRRHARAEARRLGVPLLLAGEVWPDALFVDHAHLNGRGRARLAAALRAGWADRGDG